MQRIVGLLDFKQPYTHTHTRAQANMGVFYPASQQQNNAVYVCVLLKTVAYNSNTAICHLTEITISNTERAVWPI